MYLFTGKHLFFTKSSGFTKLNYLKLANVKKGSYAESIIAKQFDLLFTYAIDLNKEYEKYYAVEFSSFTAFLSQRFCLFPDEIDAFEDNIIFCSLVSDYEVEDLFRSHGDEENIFKVLTISFLESYSK